MTRLQWAFAELDRRAAEDRQFPFKPEPGSPDWPAFAKMKRDRAGRRKRMGYSRATADGLVQWASGIDMRNAA